MSEVEKKAEEIGRRINNYLAHGGLFNPGMMKHEKVRDLLIDTRDALSRLLQELADKDKNIKEGRAVDSMWTRGRMKLYELFREAKDNTEIAIATKQYLDGNFYDIEMPIIDLEKGLADAKAKCARVEDVVKAAEKINRDRKELIEFEDGPDDIDVRYFVFKLWKPLQKLSDALSALSTPPTPAKEGGEA